MDKSSLAYLTCNGYDNMKDQIVLHAICNIVSEPFSPVFVGITSFGISTTACKLFAKFGITKFPTHDLGTSSVLVRELASTLLARGVFTRDVLQSEINRLFGTVYSGEYVSKLPPF